MYAGKFRAKVPGANSRQSGQSLFEVALVTPLLLLLLAGVVDMGRYAYIGVMVGSAARAGAAFGAKRPGDTAGIVNAACNDFLGPGANPQLGSKPRATCDGTDGTSGGTNPGGATNHLGITSTELCGCDSGGTITLYGGDCTLVDTGSGGPIATCQNGGGTWPAMVRVQASGSFNTLLNWPGVPSTVTITRWAEIRVTP
jgi:hypothetical protein